MCGICGFAYSHSARPAEAGVVDRMLRTISHRGPDGHGVLCQGHVALGHHRLSIIDVEGGHQPLANEDGTIWVTFNGEIYNYRDLRAELVARGHRFRTLTDTEVLVHAYEEYGSDFVTRLNGMFAFALYDLKRRLVLLARDQLGIKPLFYSVTCDGLFFGSEIKAVLAGTGQPASASLQSLQEYLVFRYVTWSNTFFEGVRRLPPGHLAIWQAGQLDLRRYWQLPAPDSSVDQSLENAAEALDEHVSRAVAMQLMSDVPLGTFCSGGIDSGLVTWYAASASNARLRTFSVGFEDPAWDETALATDTARRVGTDHHVLTIPADDFASLLSTLIWYNDEPLSHPNSIPLYLLSEFARRSVKVVLTGEGADELFGGYPRYQIARLNGLLDSAPRRVRDRMALFAGLLPGHRGQRLGELLRFSLKDSLLFNSRYVNPDLVEKLTGASISGALAERKHLVEETFVPFDPVASISRYELLTYVVCALDRMDRMGMACGLEARVPFLDVPLVEWAVGLKSSLKLRGPACKRMVKRLASRWLSPQIVHGAKSGFGVPLSTWFRGPAFAELLSELREPHHPAAVHFDRSTLTRLIDQHLGGAADHGEVLWLLANVYAWHTAHRSSPDPDGGLARSPAVSGLESVQKESR